MGPSPGNWLAVHRADLTLGMTAICIFVAKFYGRMPFFSPTQTLSAVQDLRLHPTDLGCVLRHWHHELVVLFSRTAATAPGSQPEHSWKGNYCWLVMTSLLQNSVSATSMTCSLLRVAASCCKFAWSSYPTFPPLSPSAICPNVDQWRVVLTMCDKCDAACIRYLDCLNAKARDMDCPNPKVKCGRKWLPV